MKPVWFEYRPWAADTWQREHLMTLARFLCAGRLATAGWTMSAVVTGKTLRESSGDALAQCAELWPREAGPLVDKILRLPSAGSACRGDFPAMCEAHGNLRRWAMQKFGLPTTQDTHRLFDGLHSLDGWGFGSRLHPDTTCAEVGECLKLLVHKGLWPEVSTTAFRESLWRKFSDQYDRDEDRQPLLRSYCTSWLRIGKDHLFHSPVLSGADWGRSFEGVRSLSDLGKEIPTL